MAAQPRVFAAAALFIGLLVVLGVAFAPQYRDGQTVVIKSTKTGKYLAVSPDGLLRATAELPSAAAARFHLVALTPSAVRMLQPAHVTELKEKGRYGCQCSGFKDEHGFGQFCHSWESTHHRPWCYVDKTCTHGVLSKRWAHAQERHLQICASEEGYLGPEGYKAAESCPCSGHESVHGFGPFCKGWEFAGQNPWCYVNDDCPTAIGESGSKFNDCVSNMTSPPPKPPSPPPPPPSSPPPPIRLIESHDGWGTPDTCQCSNWTNKHGFGAYCKGWEVEGQTPWCYVVDSCTEQTTGGSFTHRYMSCLPIKKTSAGLLSSLFGRRLHAKRRLEEKQAVDKKGKGGADKMVKPGVPVKKEHTLKAPMLPGHTAPTHMPHHPGTSVSSKHPGHSSRLHSASGKGVNVLEAQRKAVLAKASKLPRFALKSELTKGFVTVEVPPHSDALYARAGEWKVAGEW